MKDYTVKTNMFNDDSADIALRDTLFKAYARKAKQVFWASEQAEKAYADKSVQADLSCEIAEEAKQDALELEKSEQALDEYVKAFKKTHRNAVAQPPFLPTDIGDCKSWLDAEELGVSVWPDKSGHRVKQTNHNQPTPN